MLFQPHTYMMAVCPSPLPKIFHQQTIHLPAIHRIRIRHQSKCHLRKVICKEFLDQWRKGTIYICQLQQATRIHIREEFPQAAHSSDKRLSPMRVAPLYGSAHGGDVHHAKMGKREPVDGPIETTGEQNCLCRFVSGALFIKSWAQKRSILGAVLRTTRASSGRTEAIGTAENARKHGGFQRKLAVRCPDKMQV